MLNKNKLLLAVTAAAFAQVSIAQTEPARPASVPNSTIKQAPMAPLAAPTPAAQNSIGPSATKSVAASGPAAPQASARAPADVVPPALTAAVPDDQSTGTPAHSQGGTIGTVSSLAGQLKILQLQTQIAEAKSKANPATASNANSAGPGMPGAVTLPPVPGSLADSDKKSADDAPEAEPQVLNAFGRGHGQDLTADIVYKNHYYEVSAKDGENSLGDWKVASITPRVMTLTKVISSHKAGHKSGTASVVTKLVPVTFGVTHDDSDAKDASKQPTNQTGMPSTMPLPSTGPTFPPGFPFNNSSMPSHK